MSFTKTTEQASNYNHLEKMNVIDLLKNINSEDKTIEIYQVMKFKNNSNILLKESGARFISPYTAKHKSNLSLDFVGDKEVVVLASARSHHASHNI